MAGEIGPIAGYEIRIGRDGDVPGGREVTTQGYPVDEDLDETEDALEDDGFGFDDDEDDILERSQRKVLEEKRLRPRRMRDY